MNLYKYKFMPKKCEKSIRACIINELKKTSNQGMMQLEKMQTKYKKMQKRRVNGKK